MAVSPSLDQQITGRVASVNPKGVRLEGRDDWLNFSKYAGDIIPPARGQTVTLTLDRSGFVRGVDVADGFESTPASRGAPGATRDTTITRLAVLKAAAEFAASRPQATSNDVLKVAEAWEAWVTRPYDGPELTDAF